MKHGSSNSRLTQNTMNAGSQTPPSKKEVAKQEKKWVLAGDISTGCLIRIYDELKGDAERNTGLRGARF
jgi:hypothetical protein